MPLLIFLHQSSTSIFALDHENNFLQYNSQTSIPNCHHHVYFQIVEQQTKTQKQWQRGLIHSWYIVLLVQVDSYEFYFLLK